MNLQKDAKQAKDAKKEGSHFQTSRWICKKMQNELKMQKMQAPIFKRADEFAKRCKTS
jgi:hypothetical protein